MEMARALTALMAGWTMEMARALKIAVEPFFVGAAILWAGLYSPQLSYSKWSFATINDLPGSLAYVGY